MKHALYGVTIGTLFALLTHSKPTLAQSANPVDSTRTFRLGEVTVLGRRGVDSTNTALSRRIEAFNRLDVGRTLNLLPGMTPSNVGARNETMVFVRGFDLRQVPVFIDELIKATGLRSFIDKSQPHYPAVNGSA